MLSISEGSFNYDFPDDWTASKFDKDPFYLKHFQSFGAGVQAVDVLAFSNDELWLIEQKDYRQGQDQESAINANDLFMVMASKVLGTLACLVSARSLGTSNESASHQLATEALLRKKVRCVLHIEQPTKPSTLFPQVIDPKNAKDKFKRVMKSVDPRAVIGDKNVINSCIHQWQIS